MISRATARMPLALSLVAALLAGTLGTTVPAAAAEPERVELAGTVLPALLADASGIVLAAAHKQQLLNPATTVFTATAEQEAVSRIAIDTTALSAGTTLSDVQLRYAVTAAPDGGTASVQTVDAGNTRTSWLADTPLSVNTAAPEGLALTFDRAGTYTVMVTATTTATTALAPSPAPAETTTVAPDAPATASQPTTAPVTLNTAYTFDISAPAPPKGTEPSGSETTGGQPSTAAELNTTTPSAAPQPQAMQAPAASAPTVVSTGDVRVTTSLEDGELVQGLKDYSNDPKGTPLELASTVFGVPTAEAWPGGNDGEDPDTWGKIVPDHGQVWRTAADGLGSNPLALSLDSSSVASTDVHSSGGSGGIYTRLGAVDGTGISALLDYGRYDAGTSFRTGGQAPWIQTSGGGGRTPTQEPVAMAFTAPGRYCVTLETFAQRAGTGTVLNHDVALTFAVGNVDPATVEPCAQPAAIASQAPTPIPAETGGVTVVDSGIALLGSTVTDRALSLDVVTTDRGRTTAYDPAKVVFSLPNRDSRWPGTPYWGDVQDNWARMVPEGTRPWRTTGLYPSAFSPLYSLDEQANALALDLEARFIDAAALAPDQGVTYQFTGATTTSTGYFTSYRADIYEGGVLFSDNVAFWDSRAGGNRTEQGAGASWSGEPFYTPSKDKAPGSSALGTVFSEAGVYCVSLRTSTVLTDGTPVEDRATFTFAVGVDAGAVTPCSQESGEPGGGGGGGEEPGELDPTVAWMQKGHVDLALREGGDGELEFATGDPSTVGMIPLKDAVWVGRGPYATFTVSEPDGVDDRTFIGDVGSTYYGFTQGGWSLSQTLWPGISMLYVPLDLTARPATWTLSKVSGPGDVFSWANGGSIHLNSKTQSSNTFPLGHTHVHENWAFTQPGVYCLAVSARLRAAADETKDQAASSLLTVVVGDVDLSTVQPCERTQEAPPTPDPAPIIPADDRAVIGAEEAARGLELASVNGVPDVVASITDSFGAAPRYTDAEKVVYAARAFAGRYQLNALRWETLQHETGGSDVSLTLGDVAGPGDYHLTGNRVDYLEPQLDTRAGQEKTHETLWPGYVFNSIHNFTAEGVYCVPFTWSGRTVDGTAFEVTKTLTFAAGIDPATVTPCAEGGEGTDPGEGDGGGDVVWDVPNHSTTASGATIITNGHIDIASQLTQDALETSIKDSSDASKPIVYRSPEETVLQARPEAETKVPAAEAYRFLGESGSTAWLLPETEQAGVLWPGWSTESIPVGSTRAGVNWTLRNMSGPGELALYQTSFTGPQVLFNTRDGITAEDSFEIPKTTHAHGSWAFSAEGVYCLAFERATTLTSGTPVSDAFTLAVAVGRVDVKGIDPGTCFTEPGGKPSEADSTPVPVDELTEANTGTVQVLGGEAGFEAGQLVTVQIGDDRAGQWVSVWLDDAAWLGWAQVGSSGAVQLRLPADARVGAHALVVKHRDGGLIGWDSLSVTTTQNPGGDDPGPGGGGETPVPDAVWDVGNGTLNNKGATVLNNGHVDLASVLDGRVLDTRVKDTTAWAEPVWRDPNKTVLQLLPNARATVPQGTQWSFLGTPGAPLYQVEQNPQPGLLWPGWSTEEIPLTATQGGVAWALTDMSGPGEFALYQSGLFGQPNVLFNTRDGIGQADQFAIPKNTHAHGSWAFTAQGNYCLSMQRSAKLADGETVSDTFVLAIAVGTADVMNVDPARCGETVDTTPVVLAPPTAGAGEAGAVPASRNVAATQCTAGATILSSGHVDYASRIVGGKLESLLGDDTSGTKVYREPGGTILWLKPSSKVSLPAGFGQVGLAGSNVWQVPQTQNPGLLWLGWNTEVLNAGNTRGPAQWRIDRIDGPGTVKVYLSGAFGGIQQMVFDNGGSYNIPLGVHAHANWAFSAEGVYRITTTQTATLANGQVSSDTERLTIVVGNVDPAAAAGGSGTGCGTISNAVLLSDDQDGARKSAQQAAADAADAARAVLPGQPTTGDGGFTDPFTAFQQGNPVPLLLTVLGALLLIGAAAGGVLWWRRTPEGVSVSTPAKA